MTRMINDGSPNPGCKRRFYLSFCDRQDKNQAKRRGRSSRTAFPNLVLLFLPIGASLLRCNRSQSAEEPVRFIVQPRREEERVQRPRICAIAKLKRPKPVDHDDRIVRVFQKPFEFEGNRIEGRNLATAEIADDQGMAECPKIRRRLGDSPRRIKPAPMLQLREKSSTRTENLHEAEPGTINFIVFIGLLFCIHDENISGDVLDIERRETRPTLMIAVLVLITFVLAESPFQSARAMKISVIDFHFGGLEIGYVQEKLPS